MGMNITDDIIDGLAKRMAEEIDQSIIDNIEMESLIDKGWTKASVSPGFKVGTQLTEWYIATAEWIHLHATGDYRLLNGHWFFKDPKDATMFILRWA